MCYRRAAFLLLFSLLFSLRLSFCLDADAILKAVDAIRAPADDFSFNLTLSSLRNGEKEEPQQLLVRVKGGDKSLIQFTNPAALKGRSILMQGNNLWIYIPGTSKPIRISPQQRMMGQISNGDVARVAFTLDYSAKLIPNPEAGKDLTLELTAKTDQATYGKVWLWVDNKNYAPHKAQFFALSGKLLKTAYYKNYQLVLGKMRPMLLEIHDELGKQEVSNMEYSQMQAGNLPASYFQKDYMLHLAE